MASLSQRQASVRAQLKALEKQQSALSRELDALDEEHAGDRPSPEQARLIKTQSFSFTVHFERAKSLRKVRSPGMVCRSLRRFGSRKEAEQHGKRFTKLHRHQGFQVVKVYQRANAWVNWRTGKTNPVLA